MRKRVKITILGASPQSGNRGVRALLYGALRVAANAFPAADLALLEYAKTEDAVEFQCDKHSFRVESISIRFSKKFYLRNNIAMLLFGALVIRLFPFKSARACVFYLLPQLKRVDDCSLFLSIAGGDSFSDIYGFGRFIYTTLPQILVILLRKQLILLPQTLGPYNGVFTRVIAKYIMLRSDAVYTRDYTSQTEMARLFGDRRLREKLRFCYDVAFVLDTRKPQRSEIIEERLRSISARQIIGLNVSGLLYRGGYTHDDQFRLGMDYPAFTRRLIRQLVVGTDAVVLLVPHVYGRGYESDVVACERVYNDLAAEYGNRLLLLEGEYDESEIKYMIGLCDFFIGSRMHSCIAALSQCIPAVGIAYSRKFRGVYETLGLEELVADPKKISEDRLLATIRDLFEERGRIRTVLEDRIPEVKRRVLGLLEVGRRSGNAV